MSIDGATGVLYNITGGTDLTLAEINEAAEVIRTAADDEAEIIFGTSVDESLGRDVAITLIATGFQGARSSARQRGVDRRLTRPPEQVQQPVSTQRTPVNEEEEWAEPAILRFLREN
jgi:cell division protein FtsZ